eukprot:6309831-Pyramimonas_sp.AAC.1
MSHSAPFTTEQSEHETLIPLSSYPDSQRKDWFAAEGRGIVVTGLSQPGGWLSAEPRDIVAT